MPLLTIENLSPHSKWAIWEVTEPFELLCTELDLKKEAEKVTNIKNDQKKREKTAGRILLKKIIESWGELYEGTSCDLFGKPYLSQKNYFVSISHSNGYTVAIIDKISKIGIDIELIKEKIVKIAPRVFSQEEIGFRGMSDIPKLITLWSVKESLYKLYGERGLDFRNNIKIHSFDFNEKGGVCKGEVITNDIAGVYDIRYFKYKDFIISYILNK